MIEKMKFLSITGPKEDIDRVVDVYLSRYEIQLENALTELKTMDNLLPFVEVNPYKEPLTKVRQFLGGLDSANVEPVFPSGKDEILDLVRDVNPDFMALLAQEALLKKKEEELDGRLAVIQPFSSMDMSLHAVLPSQYLKFTFGRIHAVY